MNIPTEFDEIRPYTPEELPAVFEELIADEMFQKTMAYVFPEVSFTRIAEQMRKCKTNLNFQKTFCYGFLKKIIADHGNGMEMDCSAIDIEKSNYTYISNHRDIVLDSGLLDVLLIENGHNSVEIAIGDNLLIFPWIKKLVRVNKSFIVQRQLTMRQKLQSSMRMSRYMHFAITQKHEGIWIAQREGRAKDSNDLTQESILKMIAMGGEGDFISRFKEMNIVPLSISYEYDPCDYLKAKEFQQKRDIEGFKKSSNDDLINMQTGIFGYKGHVHYQMAPCLNDWLDTLNPNLPKAELCTLITRRIDKEIHRNYRLYACNYAAAALLDDAFEGKTTKQEKESFEQYIESQIAKIDIDNKDNAYLRTCIVKMYANPVFNFCKANNNED